MRISNEAKKLLVWALLIILIVIYLIMQNNWIQVEQVTIARSNIPQAFDGFKIVQISDLHLPRNPSTPEVLVELVHKQNPDVIIITGDFIHHPDLIYKSRLDYTCKALSEICDVYAVTGNHEFLTNDISEWQRILTENGVKIIDNDYVSLERNGQKLTLMGLTDNTSYSQNVFKNVGAISDSYKILLAHRPELWQTYCSDQSSIRPDLVFSGHAHGGQVRIPFVGGVAAPDQGLFPKYTYGLYSASNGTEMYVSRGLGNSIFPVRINNRPHLPVITLKSL